MSIVLGWATQGMMTDLHLIYGTKRQVPVSRQWLPDQARLRQIADLGGGQALTTPTTVKNYKTSSQRLTSSNQASKKFNKSIVTAISVGRY